MKKCPQCSRTFSDETLSFCLEDGALLSASFDHSDTQSPTVAMNAPTVAMPAILPTVASKVAPTLAAQEIPTVVANKAPTADTPQTEEKKIRWYIYLAGFFIALVWDVVMTRVLYYLFERIVYRALDLADIAPFAGGYEIKTLIIVTIFNFIIFGSLALLLGYIWSSAKWKWGLIIVLPELIVIILRASRYIDSDPGKLFLFILGYVFSFLITILVACYFSYLGSRLRQNRSNA